MMLHGRMRASAENWIDLGLLVLAEHGFGALTIDGLCRRAGKTKGSFYAHFESHDAFLAALAAYWQERHTKTVIETVESETPPEDRMTLLNHLAVRLDARVDYGMRRLAEKHPEVARVVKEIDQQRINYLTQLHQASGELTPGDARDLAIIEHAAFVGMHVIGLDYDPQELDRLYRTFVRLITPRVVPRPV